MNVRHHVDTFFLDVFQLPENLLKRYFSKQMFNDMKKCLAMLIF